MRLMMLEFVMTMFTALLYPIVATFGFDAKTSPKSYVIFAVLLFVSYQLADPASEFLIGEKLSTTAFRALRDTACTMYPLGHGCDVSDPAIATEDGANVRYSSSEASEDIERPIQGSAPIPAREPIAPNASGITVANNYIDPHTSRMEHESADYFNNFLHEASFGTPNTSKNLNYAKTVEYYGETKSRSAVLSSRRDYLMRWPKRHYSQLEQPTISCDETDRTCRIFGRISYDLANAKKRVCGSASVDLSLSFASGDPTLYREEGTSTSGQCR